MGGKHLWNSREYTNQLREIRPDTRTTSTLYMLKKKLARKQGRTLTYSVVFNTFFVSWQIFATFTLPMLSS